MPVTKAVDNIGKITEVNSVLLREWLSVNREHC